MVELKKRRGKKKPNPSLLQELRLGTREKERQMPRHDEKNLFLLPAACSETQVAVRGELKIIKAGLEYGLRS